jgi:hypothetical protein
VFPITLTVAFFPKEDPEKLTTDLAAVNLRKVLSPVPWRKEKVLRLSPPEKWKLEFSPLPEGKKNAFVVPGPPIKLNDELVPVLCGKVKVFLFRCPVNEKEDLTPVPPGKLNSFTLRGLPWKQKQEFTPVPKPKEYKFSPGPPEYRKEELACVQESKVTPESVVAVASGKEAAEGPKE